MARAQAWLWNNREFPEIAAGDLDQQAAQLAAVPSTHPLWPAFADIEIEAYQEAWPGVWKKWRTNRLGVATGPRPVDVDYEIVLFVDTRELERSVASGSSPVRAAPVHDYVLFLMHLVEGEWWLVTRADMNQRAAQRAVPGWPPTF